MITHTHTDESTAVVNSTLHYLNVQRFSVKQVKAKQNTDLCIICMANTREVENTRLLLGIREFNVFVRVL